MSDKYKIHTKDGVYFVTLTIVSWIDIFTRPEYKNLIADSLIYCQKNKGLEIYAWCLMSNHLHMICRATGYPTLSDILRDFKKYTAKELISKMEQGTESRKKWMLNEFEFAVRHLNRIENYKVWQDGNHAEEVYSLGFLYQKLEYIHQNPVRQMIVVNPEDYLYSSARNYADLSSMIDVIKISPRLRQW
ncbi:MAG TPA: transposase [Bacteroidales bacterium]|nr:transposase [Bacteroidales bacterium]